MRTRPTPRTRPMLALALLLVALSSAGIAQELVTDRPDFTESAVVVPPGAIQLEGGVSWVADDRGRETSSGPELLIRWGLSERFELRIGVPDHIEPEGGPSGLGDGSLGIKWQLGPTAWGWDAGLIGSLSLPVGDPEFTSDSVDPELIVTGGRDLTPRWGLGTQLMAAWSGEGRDESLVLGATVVLSRELGDRAGLFIELAAEETDSDPWALLAHHGYTFLFRPNLQLDLHAGVGLSSSAPDHLVGWGVSWRH